MKVTAPPLIPILRSDVQGRLLARVLNDPASAYSLTELVDWTGSSMPTVLREVRRAEAAGMMTTEKIGPTRMVRANPDHPLFVALRQVILATYGPPAVIAHEFSGLDGAQAVVLFGSWASRYSGKPGESPRDIDVLVIGEPDPDATDDAADRAEREIGLPVQVTVRSRSEWLSERESFVQEVKRRPLVVVLADESNELFGSAPDPVATA